MLRTIIYTSIILLFFGCKSSNNNESKDTDSKSNVNTVSKNHTLKYELSDTDTTKVGLPKNSDFEIGPTNMLIEGDKIYFLDPLFSKVRRIDINTSELISSPSFSVLEKNKYSWIPNLKDIAVYNDKIYITTESKSLYILDKNLNYLSSLTLDNAGAKLFYKVTEDSALIYDVNSRKIITMVNGEIINTKDIGNQSLLSEINGAYNGQSYEYNDGLVKTDYGKLNLNEQIQDITLKYYQCKNIAFNSKYFVHFSINREESIITFYVYNY